MKFSVGEVVIGQGFVNDVHNNGMEAEVIGGLCQRNWIENSTGRIGRSLAYEVRWASGEVTTQGPKDLRKKKPPHDEDRYDGNDVIPWDDCIWQPEVVNNET